MNNKKKFKNMRSQSKTVKLLSILTFAVLLSSCARQLIIKKNKPVVWEQAAETRSADKPNIIVILIDDLGFNQISSYGNGMYSGQVKTPNIDQLAEEGVLCTNGYSANAVCSPSRASLLTGRNSTRFGYEFTPTKKGFQKKTIANSPDSAYKVPIIFDEEADKNLIPVADMGLPTSEITLPELLRTQGYHNIMLGKWHLGTSEAFVPTNQGFDESLYLDGGLYLPSNHTDVVNAELPWSSQDKLLWKYLQYEIKRNGEKKMHPDDYLTDYLTNEACAAIERNKKRPFFMYLSHWGVHTPLQALKSDYDKLSFIPDHNERVQAAMVLSIDRSVGNIRETLKENGLDDNTIIIFTSDNGAPGYLGLDEVNKPYRGWKLSYFEGGVHVPYIVHYPSKIEGGMVYTEPVSSVDIFPTCASIAGAPLPEDRIIDGVNLLPYFNNEQTGSPHEALYFKIGETSVIIKDGWKLIRDGIQKKNWLFNLSEDPTEQKNLAKTNTDRLATLNQLLDNYINEQSAPLWPSVLSLPVYIDKHKNEKTTESDEYKYWRN